MQIAVELAEHADVTLATRHPLRFSPQRPLGRDVHAWLKTTGLDTAGWPLLPATGYRPGLDYLAPLNVVGADARFVVGRLGRRAGLAAGSRAEARR